ncbi:MAG: hypothetical protein ACO1NZ_18345 [Adhaeribacter sp.]
MISGGEVKGGEMKNLKRIRRMPAAWLLGGMVLLASSCSTARENSEYGATSPATITSDEQRKAIYDRGAVTNSPSSTPRRLDNKASDINRQKPIEAGSTDKPNNRPLEVRSQELGRPPADTLPQGGP